ncbi:MAG TPA: hypothetical protein VHW67_05685 [Solirubrobacteraceae bacterium]|nr:hypothetical protein [Solirubrobacteraceae bacterium]
MADEAVSHDPFGDFQTPPELASEIWRAVDCSDIDVLVEPTVGKGIFLSTVPVALQQLGWVAYDIDADYVETARAVARKRGLKARIECKDAFSLDDGDLSGDVAGKAVLAIGNPPWVTNSAQGTASSANVPNKVNRFGLRGLDAMTGKANFDIAEAILLSVLSALSAADEVRFAFLIKRSVAIKMAKDLLGVPGVVAAAFSRIEAQKWFGASVEAGLFQLTFKRSSVSSTDRLLLAETPGGPVTGEAGMVEGVFVGDLSRYAEARAIEATDGERLVWRQGIKHDVAKVLELKLAPGGLMNGFDDVVDVEDEVLCPFFKSSDVAAGRPARRRFPLYQHDLSGPVEGLAQRWPKLAVYLDSFRDRFTARGSSIYRDKPDFMLFGVGPYTLAPFKVAISGFYKEPRFTLLTPDESKRPPLVDDTCYMLPFWAEDEAIEMTRYLNSLPVQKFLASIVDTTAKRPYTKDVLGRIAAPADFVSSAQAIPTVALVGSA